MNQGFPLCCGARISDQLCSQFGTTTAAIFPVAEDSPEHTKVLADGFVEVDRYAVSDKNMIVMMKKQGLQLKDFDHTKDKD